MLRHVGTSSRCSPKYFLETLKSANLSEDIEVSLDKGGSSHVSVRPAHVHCHLAHKDNFDDACPSRELEDEAADEPLDEQLDELVDEPPYEAPNELLDELVGKSHVVDEAVEAQCVTPHLYPR
ncbi:hypothetical protein H6P81_009864 [Aristolochia fimbriata]|uniref:Uncharacterized protein n=1 Tax=Aristolochia fimbriata TaxID=158543 RepID=A0AAV7EMN3_ARIFI|nr:hypothetical protein H6P81_009864 [Aristolochia fimbriata]